MILDTLSILESYTKDKPISRQKLCGLTGLTDRQVRNDIGRLRECGYRICGTSKQGGYYMAKTDKEYMDFRRDYISKAHDILNKAYKMDNHIDGQICL